MTRAFIAMGSNVNPAVNVRAAVRRLTCAETVTGISTVYRTAAEGRPEQPDYYNAVVAIETAATPEALKRGCLRRIEAELGRRRTADKYAARTMDLDLIWYDELVVAGQELTLPDPAIVRRAFWAVPLAELAPDLVFPDSGVRVVDVAAGMDRRGLVPLDSYSNLLRWEVAAIRKFQEKGKMMKPTLQLKEEHEGTRQMLRVLEAVCGQAERAGEVNREHFSHILEFLTVFVDRCHHAKEDDLLFPAMERAGVAKDNKAIFYTREEHHTLRRYVQDIQQIFEAYAAGGADAVGRLTEQSRRYMAFLIPHMEKEEKYLFPLADRTLSGTQQDELVAAFDCLEAERIGLGRHEEFHMLLTQLENFYLKAREESHAGGTR